MSPATHARDRLGDFTAGPRMLLVATIAAAIGALAAGVAAGLVHLINGITAVAWSELRDEDHVREAGHLFAQLRLFRRKMRHVMRPVAFTRNGGMET